MVWFIYVLYYQKLDRYYVGYTDDLDRRLERHNSGWGRYTKAGIPWRLEYYEPISSKREAITREREIKRRKSRKYIEALIKGKKE